MFKFRSFKTGMGTLRRVPTYLSVVIALCSSRVFADEEEILAGHSLSGQLKAEVTFAQPLALPPSIFSGITGYATGLVGLHSTTLDEPGNDFYQFPPSDPANSQFILVAKDPGMEVWNDTGSAFMNIGESFFIGPAPFDTHPIWNIVSGTPGHSYSLTLKLHDTNGGYQDSAPFSVSFTPVPEPSMTAIIVLGVVLFRRERIGLSLALTK